MSGTDARGRQAFPEAETRGPGETGAAPDCLAGAGTDAGGAIGVRIGAVGGQPTVVIVGIDADGDGKPDVVNADADAVGRMLENQRAATHDDSTD